MGTDYKKYADAFFEYVPPKDAFRSHFSNAFDRQLENAPNVFDDIQYEKTYGKKDFEYVTGRVDSVINPSTGQKLGDDFKNFIFSNSSDPVYTGKLFKWKKNYWIATNTNTYESVSNNCVVRRCNNMLKWIDKFGNIISEPCIMIETIKQSNDYSGDKLTMISGFTGLFCQRNASTSQIVSNQRFLFGTKENRKAFRVFGDGVKNFLNSETDNDESPSVIELTIGGAYVYPDIDDLENGIANRYLDKFTLEINETDFNAVIGTQKQLTATVKNDGVIAEAPLTWTSSNPEVVSIDEDGNVVMLKLGTVSIACTLGNNGLIANSIQITVSEAQTAYFDIRITPDMSVINEGDVQTFVVGLYENDVLSDSDFIFTIANIVPSKHYSLMIIDGHTFAIQNNLAYYGDPLIVRCESGIHATDLSINLNGEW